MSRVPGALWKNLIALQIYGANTGVGKTVFSTLLAAHFTRREGKQRWNLNYIKPVSTGPSSEADDRYVRKYTGKSAYTIFQFDDPVSPHIAARGSQQDPSNEQLLRRLGARLEKAACDSNLVRGSMGIAIVETAGAVLSPGPSGTPQADLFRPLRLPAVLIGDHRLGGIGSTISAAESLIVRGYDIDAVICFDDKSKFENAAYLTDHFGKMNIPTFTLPWIPDLQGSGEEEEAQRMTAYYQTNSRAAHMYQVGGRLIDMHIKRLSSLGSMSARTKETIWHPFTQHKHIEKAADVLVFDSAYGDYFQVKHTDTSLHDVERKEDTTLLYPAFDGSASWWTQGLGHGNPKLALQAAYAAGRYGHVMFAGATHEPAITLAERMIKGLANPRLRKIFYSDNGSTATEVGIKMSLRASCKRYEWTGARHEVGVLGLRGSYHGDTIGAMDASEPCVFNEKVDWYRGRGFWFDYPTFKLRKGRWVVEPPKDMDEEFGPTQYFETMESIFDFDFRGQSPRYEAYIEKTLDKLVKEQHRKFGALIIEPCILGAGGMVFVDPLFQQSIVRVVRRYNFSTTGAAVAPAHELDWAGLPVMFDEVFTGLYRLGRFTAASFLKVHPDISVHAKLLTGGLLPLSITATSQSLFDAFWGNEKSDALLHGHSYTAHPIGCHIANVSLESMSDLNTVDSSWRKYKGDWILNTPADERAWSMWSQRFVHHISKHDRVDYVNALGSVLAVSLVDKSGSSGYSSSAAVGLRDRLLNEISRTQVRIHSRVLGNIIYLMASMTSKPKHLAAVEAAFTEKLNALSD
ncbi:PLP-dependent transferase [Setomelanomma holmii]|uniref:PLP-dependent transferase n=1 Tax=Setomelanomma holmii TaxID=210430 RepID=A0A9P4HD94_9PLEO|nr:PLP-dependent transferase [Setomelanomma holmii]